MCAHWRESRDCLTLLCVCFCRIHRICEGVTTKDGKSMVCAGGYVVVGFVHPCWWETHCVVMHYPCVY